MVSLKYWAKSDIGLKRLKNEDAFYADEDIGLFMVADGMGGHNGGDKASKIAIESAAEAFLSLRYESPKIALEQAFARSAKEVFRVGNSFLSLKGMGTTLSAVAIDGVFAHIGHIGDSRVYLLRGKKLRQITNDHSLVNEQLEAGLISADEAKISSLRNIITRAIGHKKAVTPDFYSVYLQNRDIIILCTDGLNNMISDDDICEFFIYNYNNNPVQILIDEANKRGGYDNITVVAMEITI